MNSIIANRIFTIVSNDPAKIAILDLFADGKWHTRFELETVAKEHRATIGLVGICMIIKTLQNADADLLQEYENDSGVFYRLNPNRMVLIKKIVNYLSKNSRKNTTTSTTLFKKFKEKIKTNKKSDENLKQFL